VPADMRRLLSGRGRATDARPGSARVPYDCESASNRGPRRFQSICLVQRPESSLGGVPIGADQDPALTQIYKQGQCVELAYGRDSSRMPKHTRLFRVSQRVAVGNVNDGMIRASSMRPNHKTRSGGTRSISGLFTAWSRGLDSPPSQRSTQRRPGIDGGSFFSPGQAIGPQMRIGSWEIGGRWRPHRGSNRSNPNRSGALEKRSREAK
jgi:hypothetical protein